MGLFFVLFLKERKGIWAGSAELFWISDLRLCVG